MNDDSSSPLDLNARLTSPPMTEKLGIRFDVTMINNIQSIRSNFNFKQKIRINIPKI